MFRTKVTPAPSQSAPLDALAAFEQANPAPVEEYKDLGRSKEGEQVLARIMSSQPATDDCTPSIARPRGPDPSPDD